MTRVGLLILAAFFAVLASRPAIGQIDRLTRMADTTHVEATLNEWSIQLSADTVASGTVHFMISNTGTVAHSFEIERDGEGEALEEKVEDIAAGGEATLAVDLLPGTYKVYCPQEDDQGDHEDKGMTTTLVVR